MASIGGVSVHRWVRGEVQPLGVATEEGTRPGVSGYDVMRVGARSEVFPMESFSDYDSDGARHSAHASFNGLRGYIVALVDNEGRSWDVLVKDVKVVGKKKYGIAVGGLTAGVHGLRLEWTLRCV